MVGCVTSQVGIRRVEVRGGGSLRWSSVSRPSQRRWPEFRPHMRAEVLAVLHKSVALIGRGQRSRLSRSAVDVASTAGWVIRRIPCKCVIIHRASAISL